MGNVIFAPKELDKRVRPTHNRGNEVAICRDNGWVAGTRLVGDEGWGAHIIQITAIGKEGILAFCENRGCEREGSWTFSCRDWHPVDSEAGKYIIQHQNKKNG